MNNLQIGTLDVTGFLSQEPRVGSRSAGSEQKHRTTLKRLCSTESMSMEGKVVMSSDPRHIWLEESAVFLISRHQ